MSSPQRLTSAILALALGVAGVDGVSTGPFGRGVARAQSRSQRQGSLQLTLRRKTNALEVVLEGVGGRPELRQRLNNGVWEGQLRTQGTPGLMRGPQTLSLPELGIEAVSLTGVADRYLVTVQPAKGQTLKDPVVSADGRNLILTFVGLGTPQLQTGRLDLNTPGRVPQPRYAPPLRPRAVAPPLGDMAVGTMVLQNRSFVNVSGPPVTLTLNNAPAKDALLALARLGGYGFVFVGRGGGGDTRVEGQQFSDRDVGQSVTMAFSNESYSRALNSLLMASGLQAKLDGRTLLVGTAVAAKTFGPQISKVYRLNQASVLSAADYLASLGAQISKVTTTSITSGQPASAGTSQISQETSQKQSTLTSIETYGSSRGPLVGLTGTTDRRLQTITLVGDSRLVTVAEGYLKQIDLRQRQVALNVRILDISLDNDAQIKNSFAFRSGNAFIVSDQGQLLANFGAFKPPASERGGLPGQYSAGEGTTPLAGTGSLAEEEVFLDRPEASYPFPGSATVPGGPYRPSFGTYENPLQPGVKEVDEEGKVTYAPPTRFQYPENQFFNFLVAQIQSTSAKVLASPTLIIQEGGGEGASGGSDAKSISSDGKIGRERSNEALVSVGEQLITSYEVKQDINGNNFCQPVFSNAGLTFGARVDKIDDNGFVTFSLSPQISAAVGTPEPVANCGNIRTVNSRSLDTGRVRVRDGQTLILTGVISDTDIQAVTKWPILGDIPLIGQFFRSSNGTRRKSELVILVTPRIIDDGEGGGFGYGYRPSLPAAKQVLSGY